MAAIQSTTDTAQNKSLSQEDDTLVRTSGLPILSGKQLWLSILALCLGIFLSALETTIIATALVTISSELGHFDKSSWIVVSYLLTYTGFLIIFTRMSDIFGRKQALLVAMGFFTLWSLACGVAQNIEELIVFRALQGIGGAGMYSLAMASILEITPLPYVGHTSGAVGIATSCSSILGPIVGGAITSGTTWRWVFWLNVPAGTVTMILIIFVFPRSIGQQKLSKVLFAQVDWPGVVLSLAGSVVLVFALESGGSQYPWNSVSIIVSFVVSGLCWVAFAVWQVFLTSRASKLSMLPIFPTTLVGHRVIAAAVLSAFFTGFPFLIVIFNLPQRFQIVNGLSPVEAGIRMLPLLLLTAFSSAVTGTICTKKNLSFPFLLLSNVLQIIATGLLSRLPTDGSIPASQYGLQVILGFAFGMGLVSLVVITRVEVATEDNAVAMGAITQARVLGGIIGLSIVQALLISSLRSSLHSILSHDQLSSILASAANIHFLSPADALRTRAVYGDASNLQMRIVAGFAGASLLVGCFTWRRQAIDFGEIAKGRGPGDVRRAMRAAGVGSEPRGTGDGGNVGTKMESQQIHMVNVEAGRDVSGIEGLHPEQRDVGLNTFKT